MEKVVVYICCSHLYIPTVISECVKQNGNTYVYTDKKDILELLNKLEIPVSVYLDDTGKGFVSRFFVDIKRKTNIKKWLKDVLVTDVYFFHEGYCEAGNWLMLYLSKRGRVVFHYVPIARTFFPDSISRDYHFHSIIRGIYCRLCWGYYPTYPVIDHNCPIMPRCFYGKLRVDKEEYIIVDKSFLPALLSEIEYPSNSIVLLDNPEVCNHEMELEYGAFLQEILTPLLDKNHILFKNHPGRIKKIGIEGSLKEIPSYISGNLLTRRFSCFIGVNSALLCEAANDGTKAICIANLVNLPQKKREQIVNYHKELSENILIPSSIEEFRRIIEL